MGFKNILQDDCRIFIKLMDDSYIMCEDETKKEVVVDVECRSLSPCWPNSLYALYYKKLLKAYGIGPVLVWQDHRIIGFLPLTVPNCGIPEPPLCVHYTGGLCYGAEKHVDKNMIEFATGIPFKQLSKKDIRIGCMSIHWSMRGNNLASQMILYLADWAQEHGWDRLVACVMLDNEPQAFYPTSSWWMRLGFKSDGKVRAFGPSANHYDQARAIDLKMDLNN